MNRGRPIKARFVFLIILSSGVSFPEPFDENFGLGPAVNGPPEAAVEATEVLVEEFEHVLE